VASRRSVEDLSVEDLRHLLVQRQKLERQRRIDNFYKTGRIVRVEPLPGSAGLQGLSSQADEDTEPRTNKTPPTRRKLVLDRFLLFVEIAAVVGLVFILVNGASILRNLNSEVSSALIQPTLTATPLIQAVVLPSGHTPPNAPGGVQPNDAEIPEHLRPLVQSLANVPIPTASPEQAVRIQIPAINVDAPVVLGDGWEQLKKGIGQHVGSTNPGLDGNMVVSAHNDVFGEIFKDLDQLQAGDEVIVYTNQRAYTYLVEQTQIVEPTRVEVMGPSNDPIITMISCYPYMVDDQRIVVTAVLANQ
jgi:sortase A